MLEIKSMKDLEKQKEIAKEYIDMYNDEIKYAKRIYKQNGPAEVTGIDYSSPRIQGGNVQLDYGEYLVMIRHAENNRYLHEERLAYLESVEKKIKDKLSKLEGLDYQVVYMRDIENKRLKEIADELGYSLIYIQKISARNK